MNATMVKEDDLREKIKTVMTRLESMESRVKGVESTTAAISKLEANVAKVMERMEHIESRVEPQKTSRIQSEAKPLEPKPSESFYKSAPPQIKALAGGVSVGLLIVGLIVVAWLLGIV